MRGPIAADLEGGVRLVGPAGTKAELLASFARALDFPDWFGDNWDALADSLRDLSWLPPGPVVVVWSGWSRLRVAHPRTYETALDILRHAADESTDSAHPLTVLLPLDD